MSDDANLAAMVAEVQKANGQTAPAEGAKPQDAAASEGADTDAGEVAKPAKPAATPQEDAAEFGDAAEGDDAGDGEQAGGEAEDAAEAKPKRDKTLKARFKELTDRVKAAEAEVTRLRTVPTPRAADGDGAKMPDRPDPAAFEYGPADPEYFKAVEAWQERLVDHKLEQRLTAERANAGAAAQQQAVRDRVSAGLQLAEAQGKERYPDFEAKIDEAVKARGGKPMPPLVTIAVGASPVGADVLYSLASNPQAGQRLETMLAAQDIQGAALAFGELEGVHTDDDSDLVLSDPLDMMRLNGRMKARLASAKAGRAPARERDENPEDEKPEVQITKAPEPPQQRARGSSGKMKAAADTKDIGAFMRDFGAQLLD